MSCLVRYWDDWFECNPLRLFDDGELAQLVERCDRTAEVRSSNLLFSIAFRLKAVH